jgi:hypothetical protein
VLLLSSPAAEADPAGSTNQVSALAVVPWDITGMVDSTANDRRTTVVVTNGGPGAAWPMHMRLHLAVIFQDFNVQEFDCPVKPSDTSTIRFAKSDSAQIEGQSTIELTCLNPWTQKQEADEMILYQPDADRGLLFISHEVYNPSTGEFWTAGENTLLANAWITDVTQGSEYMISAIKFEGDDPNGDRTYKFNGGEFAQFPAQILTNYLVPTKNTPSTTAELILFQLDFAAGMPAVAKVKTTLYNQAGVASGGTVLTLNKAVDFIDLFNLTSVPKEEFEAASLVLRPQRVSRPDDHDVVFGNADGGRITPVHGWLVRTIPDLADLEPDPVDNPEPDETLVFGGVGASAQALDSGETPMPRMGDKYTFYLGCPGVITEPDDDDDGDEDSCFDD